jgi:uncharacterized membrane protein
MYEYALFFHLAGAILFFAGLAVAAVGQHAAARRARPSEVALLLRTARVGVALVGLGVLLAVVFGFWLLDLTSYGLDGWVVGSLVLLALAFVAGGLGGQAPKRARRLAERLARENDRASPELQALLRDRRAAVLNGSAAAAAVAILVLMVWKPGA